MSTDDQGTRRSRRRYELKGIWGHLHASSVRIRDVSLGGVGLETNDALNVGHTYTLRIESEDGGQELEIDVAWCRFVGTQVGEQGDVVPIFQAGARAQRTKG